MNLSVYCSCYEIIEGNLAGVWIVVDRTKLTIHRKPDVICY